MERLTFDGNFCEIAQCRELPCQYGGSCSQRKVWERLKAYEDTGLEPDEIKYIKLMAMGQADAENSEFAGLPIDRLKELAEADKDGCVMVLPCKVGDTVWYVTGVGIERYIITNLDRDLFYGDYAASCDTKFLIKNFGKDVFTTREEAEAKLKEMQKDD